VPDLVIVHIAPRDPWPASGLDPFACNLVIGFVSFAARDDLRRIFQLVVDQVAMAEIGVSREVVPREVVPREGVSREGVSPGAASGGPPAEPEHGALTHTLRIDASRIDALADLVGELIVAKNRLAHLVGQTMHAAPALGRALDANQVEIERLVADLHRGVMAARMVTLTQMFGRLNRLVRDTAGRLGKDVHFETSGAATEADKSVVDGLYEPLLHVLRNAMDHGVEQAAARAASGKARAGRITLDAARARDRIVITVTDDGAGMDPARLRETARRRGLMADARLDALDDAALLDLVFTPGFSTASAVTEVSGRGVGLDAVRRSIEAMGGRVTIASTPGAGTTVRLAVPQAVTVTTVIMVRIGDERFGVPLEIVAETVRIARDQIRAVGDGVAFVLRDRTIPLVRLADLLDSPAAARDVRRDAPDLHAPGHHAPGLDAPQLDAPRLDAKVLVIETGEQRTGIEVDALAERIDVVIRPLEGLLAGARGLLGTALLGDGSVLMVVNLPELIAWMPHCNIGA
jgi:two-component system chemotaxis sensor kinase CheA